MTSEPNSRSCTMPATSSTWPDAMGCTSTGGSGCRAQRDLPVGGPTAVASASRSFTAPTSLLCTRSGSAAFITTG